MISAQSPALHPPMRRRAMTLVSSPAPPARSLSAETKAPQCEEPRAISESGIHNIHHPNEDLGVVELDADLLQEDDVDEEVILPLSRRAPRAAAEMAAASLAADLCARVVVIHSHDPGTSELRAVAVWGAKNMTDALLGATESSRQDFVASAVVTNGGALTMLLDGGLPRIAPRRLALVEAAKSVVAVPIVSSGKCVGLIEVIDVECSVTYAANACAVVGESLAESF